MPLSKSPSTLVMAMLLPGCPLPPNAANVLFEMKADFGVAPGVPGSPKLRVTGTAEATGDGTAPESEAKNPTLVGASANEAPKVLGFAAVRLITASPRLVVEKA